MRLGPIRYALRVHSQVMANPPQVHAIYIKLNRLLANFWTVTAGFLDRSVLAAAQIAPIPLTARCCLANLVLLVNTRTFWTFHNPILPIKLGTPKLAVFQQQKKGLMQRLPTGQVRVNA